MAYAIVLIFYYFNTNKFDFCQTGLQNLAALQNSTGLNLGGSTGSTATEINPANLQGLATLANLSVANPSKCKVFYSVIW